MPNNDFDKILKDKLKGYEADFNPADWQKMEVMLPQDSRKFFAVIASLFVLIFLAVGVLTLNNVLNSDGRSVAEQVGELEPGYGGTRYDPGKVEASEVPQTSGVKIGADAEEPERKAVNKNAGTGTNDIPNSTTENQSLSLNQLVVSRDETAKTTTSKIAGTENRRRTAKNKNESGKMNLANTLVSGGNSSTLIGTNAYSKASGQQTAAVSAVADASDESAEALAMLGAGFIPSSVLFNENQISPSNVPEPVFRKKKKVFAFVLGAGAGPLFSFIDPNYLSKPGYTTGISQEFMFIQRIGPVLSESYAHRKYNGGKYPCAPGLDCPQSYSSEVKSVDFGVDVKANLIHTPRWNWYATAGVINVLKIKETFEYHYVEIDTVPLPNSHSLSPATNFNGGGQSENFDAITGGLSGAADAPDLSISGTKRYHLAYHVATGFDVTLNSVMKLQFDAGYSFTKRTVGAAEKRLQDVGVNGRMLFLFGK